MAVPNVRMAARLKQNITPHKRLRPPIRFTWTKSAISDKWSENGDLGSVAMASLSEPHWL